MTLAVRTALALLLAATPPVAASDAERLAALTRYFAGAPVLAGPEIVDCTLSGGTDSRCFALTVATAPTSYTPGPWCPRHISDDASAGGIWLFNGEALDVDGAFIQNLATLYGDTKWQLFDPETGAVRFTGTLEACEAAARPDVDPTYQNYCVECLPEYVPPDITLTFVIPLNPEVTDTPNDTHFSGSGITFDGIRLDAPAPVEAILGAYTVAPFDDCGGHVNLHVGYHIHAVTACHESATLGYAPEGQAHEHAGQVGLAMDGYPIFGHSSAAAPGALDQCNGHDTGGGYHYHAGAAGSNAILGCLRAEAGCVLTDGETTCDASRRPRRPNSVSD